MGSDPLSLTASSSSTSRPARRRMTSSRSCAGPPSRAARRGQAGKPKVGHTGTLDPLASGVLPLVIGKATRLAQFLSSAEKEYEAHVELGVTTTTLDRGGDVVTRDHARTVAELTPRMIEDAVAEFRGTYLQQPPASPPRRSTAIAPTISRAGTRRCGCSPSQVTATALDVLEWRGTILRLRLVCSAGYYVRSLADAHRRAPRHGRASRRARADAQRRLHAGGCRRARCRGPQASRAAARVIPLASAAAVAAGRHADPEGASLAARGGFIGPAHVAGPVEPSPTGPSAAIAPRRAPGRHRRAARRRGFAGFRVFFASRRRTGLKLLVWD